MALRGNEGQPKDAGVFIQARVWERRSGHVAIGPMPGRGTCLFLLATLVSLSACANRHEVGPEAWWHAAIGGKIAEQRPAPPGDSDPFPKLGVVPPKPPAPDQAAMNRLTAGLVADRTAANEAAAQAPIPQGGERPPPPPPLNDGAASASLMAMTRPPPAAVPARPADAPAAKAGTSSTERPSSPVGNAPSSVTLLSARPGTTRLSPATALPLAPATPPGVTDLDFTLGSSVLGATALDRIRDIAVERGERAVAIAVTGHGEATSPDSATQAAGLELGLARARAIATALTAQGVPASSIRMNAEATGRGASLRLLQ